MMTIIATVSKKYQLIYAYTHIHPHITNRNVDIAFIVDSHNSKLRM